MEQWLREQVKYQELPPIEGAVLHRVREELWRILGEYGVELDE